MKTDEKRLSNYKGFIIYKITDNKGTQKEVVIYEAETENGDLFDCKRKLSDLKKSIDRYCK